MRHTSLKIGMLCCLLLLVVAPAGAEVKLPAIIGNNMVLQADMPLPIWGWAAPDEKVTVTLGEQKQTAAADKDGKWMVKLTPVKASDKPLTMTVAGANTITLTNILVGEVWICSGQSNMQFGTKQAINGDQEVASSKNPKIRLFKAAMVTASEPQKDTKGEWLECDANSVPSFSAVGYFFGRDLNKVLNVPMGLIHTNWGGTCAETWTSKEMLDSDPDFKVIWERFNKSMEDYPKNKENWEKNKDKILAKHKEAVAKAKAEGKQAPRGPQAPSDPALNQNSPCRLYNAMLNPLIPYAIRGAIWYQGESNSGRAVEYRKLFPAMITDWRKHWGQGDFPFLFVQLANFMDRKTEPVDENWAWLREAQSMTLSLPNTGQAVIIDIGEAKDIHPKNKQDVGTRLSLAAQKIAYGKDVVYSGPTYVSCKADGGKAVVKFANIGGGMIAKGDKLTGFAVAGEDKKFVWADAKIEGDTVVVSSKDVAKPVAVRYAWANNPECNLYNKEGLPASPFRTDTWEGAGTPAPTTPAKK